MFEQISRARRSFRTIDVDGVAVRLSGTRDTAAVGWWRLRGDPEIARRQVACIAGRVGEHGRMVSFGGRVTMTTRWLNDGEQAAWRSWLDMYRLLLPALDRQLQSESRASFTDFEVLVHLSEAPGRRLRMSEIAERTLSTRSAITRTVDRLVARAWVVRVRSEDDQRGYYADLTDLGAAVLLEIAPGHVDAVRAYLIDLLTEPELAALRSIGTKVRGRMVSRSGPPG